MRTSNRRRDRRSAARDIERDGKRLAEVSETVGDFDALAAVLCAGINEELHVRRYATEGVRVEAKIVRCWMYRVGVTTLVRSGQPIRTWGTPTR